MLESKIMMICGRMDLFQSISHDPLVSGKKGKKITPGGKSWEEVSEPLCLLTVRRD